MNVLDNFRLLRMDFFLQIQEILHILCLSFFIIKDDLIFKAGKLLTYSVNLVG